MSKINILNPLEITQAFTKLANSSIIKIYEVAKDIAVYVNRGSAIDQILCLLSKLRLLQANSLKLHDSHLLCNLI